MMFDVDLFEGFNLLLDLFIVFAADCLLGVCFVLLALMIYWLILCVTCLIVMIHVIVVVCITISFTLGLICC